MVTLNELASGRLQASASASTDWRRCAGPALLLLAVAGTLSYAVPAVAHAMTAGLSGWHASSYYVTFTTAPRRGLPGAVLAAMFGGPPPLWAVNLAGVTLSGIAAVAFVWLAVRLIHRSAVGTRALVAAVLVASPFGLALLCADVGRYDAVAFLAGAVMVLLSGRRLNNVWLATATGAVLAVATASEEFLLAFLAPVAVVVLVRAAAVGVHWLLAFVPAAAVVAVSVLERPEVATLRKAIEQAQQRGVQVSTSDNNAITALNQNAADGWFRFSSLAPTTQLVMLLGGLAVFVAVTASVVLLVVDRDTARTVIATGVWTAGCASAMCLIGVDYRRWWALAFVAVVAVIAMHRPSPGEEQTPRLVAAPTLLLCVLVIAGSLLVQRSAVFPAWDPANVGIPVTL